MQIDYRIERATFKDLDEIALSEVEIFKENAWHKVSIEAEFYKHYSDIFIARESNDKLIGYSITWCIKDDISFRKECELITLAINEKFRMQGIASALLKNAMKIYGEDSIWHLEVAENNIAAQNLYKKLGFSINGRIKNYYGNNQDALRMIKE